MTDGTDNQRRGKRLLATTAPTYLMMVYAGEIVPAAQG